jgi:RNA polymerase sigma-32 factor
MAKKTLTKKKTKTKTKKELIPVSNKSEVLAIPTTTKEVSVYAPGAGDPLSQYLKQIRKYELLSPEQEDSLTQALEKTGDVEVAKKLVLHNLRLVVKIAMEYRSSYQNVMDLIQEGNIGLMKAVSKYDGSKGAKLSYYASWWIRSYILKFILDNFRLVKIGTSNEQKKLFYNLLKEKNRLIGLGIEPEAKLLAENLGVTEKSVNIMDKRLGDKGGEISLDSPLTEGSSDHLLRDILPDPSGQNPEEIFSNTQDLELLKGHLNKFVSNLAPRDKEIFKKRLLSEVPPSLQSIADEYGVTRERIRQIESRLIDNLKVYMSDIIR